MQPIWTSSYPAGVPHEINPFAFQSIPELYDSVEKKFPDRAALVCMDCPVSYKELNRLSKDMAAYLQSLPGLEPGDRVAIMMPNLSQYMISLLGIMRAGFIAVNVNPLYTGPELAHQLADCDAKVLIIIENFAQTFESVASQTPVKHVITTKLGDLFPWHKRVAVDFALRYVKKMVPKFNLPGSVNFRMALKRGHRAKFTPAELKSADIALLQYTGGTTGVAKGAMLTHGNVIGNVEQLSAWIASTFVVGHEIAMTALPLYHIFSLTATICFAKYASTQVLVPNPRDIPAMVKLFEKWRFSVITGVNTLFNTLERNKSFAQLDFKNLKLVVGGGAQVQKAVADRWAEITGVQILEAYGLTETSPGVCGNLPGAPWDGTVGFPIPSTLVSIRDDDFNDMGFAENEDPETVARHTGEICVKGPQVMAGYWNKPEETAKVMQDGWLHTGDIGYMAANGSIRITDRKKDLIIVNGLNVYPNEIEGVIAALPGVLEVGVVGVKNPKIGEMVKAVIVKSDPNITRDDVVKYCRSQLTGYKVPRTVVFVKSLPKSPVGKVLRRELRNMKDGD